MNIVTYFRIQKLKKDHEDYEDLIVTLVRKKRGLEILKNSLQQPLARQAVKDIEQIEVTIRFTRKRLKQIRSQIIRLGGRISSL